ncbi:MAG: hypothetical protein H6876_10680 [Hyphomicrobiaceae bacterium]|nr:hypothetical protein [Hyphomicrobiaceae bacterium]
MGGFGSGRPSCGGRATVETCRSIDVNRLRKDGALVAGWSGTIAWTRNSEQVASIGIRGGHDKIMLNYRWKQASDDWQDVVEHICISWRPCRFGGERPLFECPGVVSGAVCSRPTVKLYGASRYFLCRHCCRLTYSSRNEDRFDRALRRANKIRMRLGGEPGIAAAFPERPKGMWRRTYERLSHETLCAERHAEARLQGLVLRFLDVDRAPKKGYWR